MDSQETADLKAQLRRDAAAAREAAYRENPEAGADLRAHFDAVIAVQPGAAVSGYWPLEGELDIRPVLEHLHSLGHPIGLPVVLGKNQPLVFRQWRPGIDLVKGSFNVHTPPPEMPEVIPQVLLVPLLAFDPDGYRLGYGGGFYDRTLEKLRRLAHALAVGVAYAAQEMPFVPRGPFDQPLDWIVTERAAFNFNGKNRL
jgi:5-formyltetrahydrofolate cyclo-ligase